MSRYQARPAIRINGHVGTWWAIYDTRADIWPEWVALYDTAVTFDNQDAADKLADRCNRQLDATVPPTKRPYRRRTHCNRGHKFTPENTRTDKAGKRTCRACCAAWARNRRARTKEGANL